ncbi:hypothetical protein SEVIR_2G228332v4 [Setaria viridis]|uniref:FBD domain-containing protein n=1 Tax=Setaria viridis TaxID=4556 RepID=A0A4U6VZ49_SETVI|nr:hypothetical protein SEVIR_2G228332v2 [Setaria viridis]
MPILVWFLQGIKQYKRFLEDTNKLASCEVLVVRLETEHGCKPTMLRLLRKCAGLRKIVVELGYRMDDYDYPCKSGSCCPCSCLENRMTNHIVLDSIEEVEIRDYGRAADKVELVRLFATLSARCKKRVSITVSERCEDMHEKIRSICPPNDKVEIVVRST